LAAFLGAAFAFGVGRAGLRVTFAFAGFLGAAFLTAFLGAAARAAGVFLDTGFPAFAFPTAVALAFFFAAMLTSHAPAK
jgi:hypothetical protein